MGFQFSIINFQFLIMRFYWLFCFLYCAACAQNNPAPIQTTGATSMDTAQSTVLEKARLDAQKPAEYADGVPANPRLAVTEPATAATKTGKVQHPGFVDVVQLDPSIRLDIRYATTDNFTKAKIYDCPACLLRVEAAQALVKAHKALQKKGLGLKMFDCYRPRPYQQRLWDKVPNPDYVTPPAKGSMHSRGAAVDLTIVDASGKELDMGTPYDFFGVEAHTDYKKHTSKIQANRDLLRETLDAVGFKGIRTEWWHFSYQAKDYALSDYVWPCF
jgi:zinc D-Ala-D-Ala dipeptidase